MIHENGTLIIRDINYSNGGIYQVDTGGNTERNLTTFHVQVVGQLRQTFKACDDSLLFSFIKNFSWRICDRDNG